MHSIVKEVWSVISTALEHNCGKVQSQISFKLHTTGVKNEFPYVIRPYRILKRQKQENIYIECNKK